MPRVLLVDDEPSVIALARSILRRGGYDVVPAADALEAIRYLDASVADGGKRFDCVITDALMPLITGYELVRLIRAQSAHDGLPVMMLTRQRLRESVRDAVEAGVTDYVIKPIDEYLLLDKVALAVRKGAVRQVFELTLAGEQCQARLETPCRVVAVSENDITILTPFALRQEHRYPFKTGLFEEMGVPMPQLKLQSCEPAPRAPDDAPDLRHLSKFAFLGVGEDDLKKIRSWIQREAIKRRK